MGGQSLVYLKKPRGIGGLIKSSPLKRQSAEVMFSRDRNSSGINAFPWICLPASGNVFPRC